MFYLFIIWSDTSRKKYKTYIVKIQRSMMRYVFNYAEVDYKVCLLMTNIPPVNIRREYTDIFFI